MELSDIEVDGWAGLKSVAGSERCCAADRIETYLMKKSPMIREPLAGGRHWLSTAVLVE